MAMLLFQGYQDTLKSVFKRSFSDIIVNSTTNNLSNKEVNYIENSISDITKIKAWDKKIEIPVLLSKGNLTKPSTLGSFDNDNIDFNSINYPFSKNEDFHLRDNEIILGKYLAKDLNVSQGDTVQVILPKSIRLSIFGLIKKSSDFIVKEIYSTGLYEIDKRISLLELTKVQGLIESKDNFSFIPVLLEDNSSTNISNTLNRFHAKNSFNNRNLYGFNQLQNNESLFSTLELQRIMIFLILNIIVLVASFNVVSTLSSIILERNVEIGILLTLGLTKRQVKKLYYYFSLFLTNISIILGLILGTIGAYQLSKYSDQLLKADVYFIDKIIVSPSLDVYLTIYLTALVIVSTTIFWSLKTINKLNVIEIIRS